MLLTHVKNGQVTAYNPWSETQIDPYHTESFLEAVNKAATHRLIRVKNGFELHLLNRRPDGTVATTTRVRRFGNRPFDQVLEVLRTMEVQVIFEE